MTGSSVKSTIGEWRLLGPNRTLKQAEIGMLKDRV